MNSMVGVRVWKEFLMLTSANTFRRVLHRPQFRSMAQKPANLDSLGSLQVLVGGNGIGKSSFLVHFPQNRRFQELYENQDLLISMLTYTHKMTGGPQALGLRLLYGVVAGKTPGIRWENFVEEQKYNWEMPGLQAILHLRRGVGAKVPIFLAVDDLHECKEHREAVMRDILSILDTDIYTDVIVSVRSPRDVEYIWKDLGRRVQYTLLPSLTKELADVSEFMSSAERVLSGVSVSNNNIEKANMVVCAARLASGHPGTCADLVQGAMDPQGELCSLVRAALDDPKVGSYAFLLRLAGLRCFDTIAPPTTSLECDLLLSRLMVLPEAPIISDMLEGNRGLLWTVPEMPHHWGVSTTLATFFRIVTSDESQRDASLLLQIARALLRDPALPLAEVLVRTRALSVLSNLSVHANIGQLRSVQTCAINKSASFLSEGMQLTVSFSAPVKKLDGSVTQRTDTIRLPARIKPLSGGWDIGTYLVNGNESMYAYEAIVFPPPGVNVEATALRQRFCDGLVSALADYTRCLATSSGSGADGGVRVSDAGSIVYYFTVYAELPVNALTQQVVLQELHTMLERTAAADSAGPVDSPGQSEGLHFGREDVQRAIEYVQHHWQKVQVLDKQALEDALIPTLVPLAAFLQRVIAA